MLATLHNKSKLYVLSIATLILISACSRDNPLDTPKPYVEEDPYCLDGSPYVPILMESLDITDLIEALPTEYPQEYIGKPISVSATYLTDKLTIKPVSISDYALSQTSDEESEAENILIVKNKTLNMALSEKLTEEERLTLTNFSPEVNSLSMTVTYNHEGNTLQEGIDEEIKQVTSRLDTGMNEVTINVKANIEVPRTSLDCREPIDPNNTELDVSKRYKSVTIEQVFPIIINRQDINDFAEEELTSAINLTELDQFGKVIALSDKFLVIGLPNEDTDAQGIYSSSDIEDSSIVSINESAQNSGAVLIYTKNSENIWTFHSLIKSSNNESGDQFGTALALSGKVLAISSPGEDSIASGLFHSFENLDGVQGNNSASSSGAVYLYEFNESADAWIEQYYIKPDENVISDGNYDKGFGLFLAINDQKLLISAPKEDSKDGVFSDSSQPDSGAVYSYDFIVSDNDWVYDTVLKAINPNEGDKFGSSLSLNQHLIAVGAPFEDSHSDSILNNIQLLERDELQILEDNAHTDSGAVYIFGYTNGNTTIQLHSFIKSSNSDPFDYFGASLALYNSSLYVGATGEDSDGKGLNRNMAKNNLSNSGAVYSFLINNENIWVEDLYIKANDSQEESSFGKNIVRNGDTLFIGAPLFDTVTHTDAGKVYLYNVEDNNIEQELLFQKEGSTDNMRYGDSLALIESFLAVGANGFTSQENGIEKPFSGKVFTYE